MVLLVDGIPLSKLDLVWWCDQIAVASQGVYLFKASVAQNTTYGKLDATREELVAAKTYRLIANVPSFLITAFVRHRHEHVLGIRNSELAVWSVDYGGDNGGRFEWIVRDTAMGATRSWR
jgi:hypothetical protein